MAKPVVNMPIYKQFMLARTALYMALAAVFLCFSQVSMAQTNPAYTVEGVEVDAIAENAVKAREKALDEAQAKAYQMLAERFLSEEQLKKFKVPDPITLSSLVQDFEVTKEQLSARRYKGVFTIRFRPNAMRTKLAAQGDVYSDEIRKPLLILPFYQVRDKTELWGEGNPFMSAWRAAPADKNILQPMILPLGDAQDIGDITGDEGLEYDAMRVQEMAERYGADDVAILVATFLPSPVMEGLVMVRLYQNGFEGPQFVQEITIKQTQGEAEGALYNRVVEKIRGLLRKDWKANAAYIAPVQQQPAPPVAQQPAPPVPALGPLTNYNVFASFASVQEWVRLKNTLDHLYGMEAVMIKSMKPQGAVIDLRFAGDISALQRALQMAGLNLRNAGPNQPMVIETNPSSQPVYR